MASKGNRKQWSHGFSTGLSYKTIIVAEFVFLCSSIGLGEILQMYVAFKWDMNDIYIIVSLHSWTWNTLTFFF